MENINVGLQIKSYWKRPPNKVLLSILLVICKKNVPGSLQVPPYVAPIFYSSKTSTRRNNKNYVQPSVRAAWSHPGILTISIQRTKFVLKLIWKSECLYWIN